MMKSELSKRIIRNSIELFGEKGYENTTISQIIEKTGCSKGGFYHHFESKKQILGEITSLYLSEISDGYQKMVNQDDNTITLINKVFATVNDLKKEKLSQWRELVNMFSHSDSNSIIQTMAFAFVDMTAGIYEELIVRGIGEGLFNPPNPKALAETWSHEIMRLYGKVTEIVLADGDETLRENFSKHAEYVENLINMSLGIEGRKISIKEPAIEYLEKTLDMMKKVSDDTK